MSLVLDTSAVLAFLNRADPNHSSVERIRELEEIRRMLISVTGDPDLPIEKVIVQRRPPWAKVLNSEAG